MDKVLPILVLALITFYLVYPLIFPPMKPCPHCNGGKIYDAEHDRWFDCSVCNGSGVRS